MKYLLVGDVHAMANDLVDAQNLLDYCIDIIVKENVDVCFFSGDLFNYFNIVHLPVLKFWGDNLEKLRKLCQVVALVGNHDFGAGNPEAHALVNFKGIPNITIVDKPTMFDGRLFMPYYGSKRYNEFIQVCRDYSDKADMLFCHETYDGAQYENGFYAKDGLVQDEIPQSKVYAGHIHKMANIGKITYIGSPRWITISDANQDKFLWLEDFDNGTTKLYATGKVCSRISHLSIEEGKDNELPEFLSNDRITVDLRGSPGFIQSESAIWMVKGAKIRTFPTKNYTSDVKESDGVWTAFSKFTSKFKPKNNTPTDKLLEIARERLNF